MRNTFKLTPTYLFLCALFMMSTLLTSCGFELRGVSSLSFKALNLQGRTLSISRELKRNIKANEITLTPSETEADLIVKLINESSSKRIQSLSGTGVVREFELYYRVSFSTRTPSNPEWGPVQTVQLRRDYSYNDDAVLGKAEEEARLNADMHTDAVREIIRRLSAIQIAPQ
jgi:LPS-assembly lipoprotein